MAGMLRELIALSVICGALMKLCPEGGAKRAAALLSTAVLSLAVLSALTQFDFSVYALESAKLTEAESRLGRDALQKQERLKRSVIQAEYQQYILKKAEALGLDTTEAEVRVEWALDGLWVPYAVRLRGERSEALGRIIRDDLGIPYERQYWYSDGADEGEARRD